MINQKNTENKIICSYCKSEHIKKDGRRKTKNRDLIQRYKCLDCKRRFILDNGFYRMRNSPNKITLCLDLFFRGISTRSIQKHLQAFYPHNSSHVSIYEWIVKYSNLINKFTDKLNVNAGNELMSDEVEYRRRKSHKAKLGIESNWFVDVMDTKTRFMVSSEYMQSRTINNLTRVLKRAKFSTGEQITVVTTNGLQGYPRVLKKTFGLKTHWNHKSRIVHNVVIASERGFNHKIERLHNTIRDRTKIMRGFHGSLESAYAIMKGFEIYYNFIRKHQGIDNKTPSEEAIPELALSTNKWLSLIKLSKS